MLDRLIRRRARKLAACSRSARSPRTSATRAAGVVGSWAYNLLVVYDSGDNYVASLVEHQVFVHPGGSSCPSKSRPCRDRLLRRPLPDRMAPTSARTLIRFPRVAGDLRLAADAPILVNTGVRHRCTRCGRTFRSISRQLHE